MSRSLTVAAIQIRCDPLRTKENLAHAETFIEQAAVQGAGLVLLPELMPGGYLLTEDIWNTAESITGPSVAWLKKTALRFGIFLGMSYAEADGSDFFNSFVLATPQGTIAGRVRKSPPASVEAYFFRGGNDPHYIDTEIGRIGVGICYENLLYERIAALHQASVDIVIQPTAAGTPTPAFPMRRKDSAAFDCMLKGSVAFYAQALGVPVVMANRSGPLVTPLPGGFPAQNTSFPGLSAVANSDGTLMVQLGSEEGIALATVALDPSRKVSHPPKAYGRWALPVPWYAFLWPLTQKFGERAYARHPSRSNRAFAIADADS
ncbi:MAG: carbon-nitrogen hydrolase family protein [Proteobacteria bacterium]|nr:carbon-nitrogen hydrolase family protein [Pseudomonadota bacterium]